MRSGWRIPYHYQTLLLIVGFPFAGLGIVVATALLRMYGPDWLAGNMGGRGVLQLLALAGCAIALVALLGCENIIVLFGAFFAIIIGLNTVVTGIEEFALRDRGTVTACTVITVDTRIEYSTDADGHQNSTTYYDHRTDCADDQVTLLTRTELVAEPGTRIEVLFDPAGAVGPRLAEPADPDTTLWFGLGLLAVGIGLRLLHEFDVPPLRGGRR